MAASDRRLHCWHLPVLGVGCLLGVELFVLRPQWVSAQPAIDSGRSLPLVSEEQREMRLIEGMNRGIREDYRGAIVIFSELIQRYPDYAEAYFNRGIARAKLQDYQGAITDQTQALTHNPQLAEAYEARAKLYWQLGQPTQAVNNLQQAVSLFEQQGNPASASRAQAQLSNWLETDSP